MRTQKIHRYDRALVSVSRRNNVQISGVPGAQPILFSHGFGCDQNMWRFVAPAFEDEYRVVLFDHIGHGGSDLSAYDPLKYDSLDGYAEDVLDIVRELELTDVVFVGHSVSSIIGVLAAIAADVPQPAQQSVACGGRRPT